MSSLSTRLTVIEQKLKPRIRMVTLLELHTLTEADKQLMREQGIAIPIPLEDLRKVASDE